MECERESANSGCVPVAPIRLSFAAEAPWSVAKKIRLSGPDGRKWAPADAEHGQESESQGQDRQVRNLIFKGPFPEKAELAISLPEGGIQDESGRALQNVAQFPLHLKTEAFSPLAKFAAPFGIIESKPEAVLPVTLRKVEAPLKAELATQDLPGVSNERFEGSMIHVSASRMQSVFRWMAQVASQQDNYDKRGTPILSGAGPTPDLKVETFDVPRPGGEQAFEVVGIPLKGPGFYVVQLKSELLGKHLLGADRPMYVSTAALVTDLAVHFKQGRESSLAWITTLEGGKDFVHVVFVERKAERMGLLGDGVAARMFAEDKV
jgi:hypothetical protein